MIRNSAKGELESTQPKRASSTASSLMTLTIRLITESCWRQINWLRMCWDGWRGTTNDSSRSTMPLKEENKSMWRLISKISTTISAASTISRTSLILTEILSVLCLLLWKWESRDSWKTALQMSRVLFKGRRNPDWLKIDWSCSVGM